MPQRSALDLSDVLKDITAPDLSSALADLQSAAAGNGLGTAANGKPDLFAEKKRRGWDKSVEARCDFTPKPSLRHRAGLYFLSLWQKSVYGRTLTDIKADDAMVPFFADSLAPLITEVLGEELAKGGWCIITTPRRRHKERNFATMTAALLGERLRIPFYEDVCSCHSRQRMYAVFTVNKVPKEQNIILYDDFVTTGQTLLSMKTALAPYHRNILPIVNVNNKL